MCKTGASLKGHYEYDVSSFQLDEPVEEMAFGRGGQVHLRTASGSLSFSPLQAVNDPSKIKVFAFPEYHAEFSMDTKKLARVLLLLKSELAKAGRKEEEAVFTVDTLKKEAGIEGIESANAFTIEVKKGTSEPLRYSFSLLRDLLINARTVSPRVDIKSYSPYCSLIQYLPHAGAVITHAKK